MTFAEWCRDYLVAFKFPKKAVIRSARLRVPELIIQVLLVSGVIGYEVVYHLHFLAPALLDMSIDPLFLPVYSNWWECNSMDAKHPCHDDDPPKQSVCSSTQEAQEVSEYDAVSQMVKPVMTNLSCRRFDNSIDISNRRNLLMIGTRTKSMMQQKNIEGVWEAVNDSSTGLYLSGFEQIVAFKGFPGPPAYFDDGSLIKIQGFIQYHNETSPRRIRCTHKHTWQDCDTPGGDFWAAQYPMVSGTDPAPEFTYNGTGCMIAPPLLRCHLTELLAAAGVEMDHKGEVENAIARLDGLQLHARVVLENADSSEFWRSPIGFKKKFTIHVEHRGVDRYYLWKTYQYNGKKVHDKTNEGEEVREVTAYFGISLSFGAVSDWRCYSHFRLLMCAVVALSTIKWAGIIVTSVLLAVYKRVGCLDTYLLFAGSAYNETPTEREVMEVLDDGEFGKIGHVEHEARTRQMESLFASNSGVLRRQRHTPSASSSASSSTSSSFAIGPDGKDNGGLV